MLDFQIEDFVRKHVTKRPVSILDADFSRSSQELHRRIDGKSMLVVGGAGTIGSNYVKAALSRFTPRALYVVDIDENALTELTRQLRSGSGYRVPEVYVTEPLDLGSKLFEKFFRACGPFDVIANFAARKHVRAERDVYSIEAMCETNVFMAKKLLDLMLEAPPEHFFCVSTDKAANPVNIMGATKKLMEETVMAYSDRIPVKTARFANVAFSNGSLPWGWLNRIANRQPLSCPTKVRRFFVSPIESGELCLFASVMGRSGDIFYPKLDPERDMISFESIVRDMLACMGRGCHACESAEMAKLAMGDLSAGYPVDFCPCDTSGEKMYEEFFTSADNRDETTYINLGVIMNTHRRRTSEVCELIESLRATLTSENVSKESVLRTLAEYLPTFHHVESGRKLDDRM